MVETRTLAEAGKRRLLTWNTLATPLEENHASANADPAKFRVAVDYADRLLQSSPYAKTFLDFSDIIYCRESIERMEQLIILMKEQKGIQAHLLRRISPTDITQQNTRDDMRLVLCTIDALSGDNIGLCKRVHVNALHQPGIVMVALCDEERLTSMKKA